MSVRGGRAAAMHHSHTGPGQLSPGCRQLRCCQLIQVVGQAHCSTQGGPARSHSRLLRFARSRVQLPPKGKEEGQSLLWHPQPCPEVPLQLPGAM